MKKFKNTMSRTGAGLLGITALILMMIFAYAPTAEAGKPMAEPPPPETAAVDCASPSATADVDADGFTDAEECSGITLVDCSAAVDTNSDGLIVAEECAAGAFVPSCSSSGEPCMHPDTKDLFVILVDATGSNIPANPLEYVSRPISEGGLGIFAHQIAPNQAGQLRYVTSAMAQKAVRITESLNINGEILGAANYGTPMGPDLAIIYTQRIVNLVDENTAGYAVYLSGTPSTATEVKEVYIKHTLAHEIGHAVMLVPEAYHNDRFGTYHWKTGSGYVMDQSVVMTKKGSKVTFFINDGYAEPSQLSPALR